MNDPKIEEVLTFKQFIEQIRRLGDSAILFDRGGDLTEQYYDEKTDALLDFFDQRCAGWDLWQEAKTEADFDTIAASLIPSQGKADHPWVDAARLVFAAAAYRMKEEPDRSMVKLLRLLLSAELSVFGDYLQGTKAQTLISDNSEKIVISIRSVISICLKSCLRSCEFLQECLQALKEKETFVIRDWMQSIADSSQGRFLFIADQMPALRPLSAMWLSMVNTALLSLEANDERRIWFICDDLACFHQLPQLAETIAEVKQVGGCFVVGLEKYVLTHGDESAGKERTFNQFLDQSRNIAVGDGLL